MSVRISLTLEASEMFLSLHMVFTLERAAVVWTILERISGFDLGNTIPPEIKRSLTIGSFTNKLLSWMQSEGTW